MTEKLEKLIGDVNKIDNQIFDLNQTIASEVHVLQSKKRDLQDKLDQEVVNETKGQFSTFDYNCGTVNVETASFKIKATISKKIKWDEDVLRKIANQIRAGGQDPETYIKYKLSVSETDFKKFTADIQETFSPARSVEPSAPKISIEKK